MLTDNKIKEEISLAYVMAVAAVKSFSTEMIRIDYDSVDATIRYSGILAPGESIIYSPAIELQLKATSKVHIVDDFIHFSLPIKNYNDLRADTIIPRLLVVLHLPELKDEWVTHSTDELIMKKCAYYLNLCGFPESKNLTTVTVIIPLVNVFSPDSLYDLMLNASKKQLQ